MPHRILEDFGFFDFSEARPVVEGQMEALVRGRLKQRDSDRYFDYVMLTTAEAAIASPAERILTVRNQPPVMADRTAAHTAIFKCDSSPTWPHFAARLRDARLWDVILYAGDMSKVARAAGENVEALFKDNGFAAVVAKLKSTYREADNPMAAAVAESQSLDLLGVLWHAKAALIDDPEGADESVTNYVRRSLPPSLAASR